MSIKIAIINCYADEAISAPSANLFVEKMRNSIIINHCYGEKINDIKKYDGYVISGSRSCHLDQDDWIIDLHQLIKNIYQLDIPCLAVCFGHQLVANIFGGKTVKNLGGEEGFQDIPNKFEKNSDNLFTGLPNPVKVYQSHNDSVMKTPPGSFQVISNDTCVQYYQYGSIMSIQSHPEVDVSAAERFAKRDKKDIKIILNGVNEKNIQSQTILDNFNKIIYKSI